jgi:hypothetical protein
MLTGARSFVAIGESITDRHIENRLQRIHDVTYAEDHTPVRTCNTPRVMATVHNLANSTLRHHGRDNIAKDPRYRRYNPTRPHTLPGITTKQRKRPCPAPTRTRGPAPVPFYRLAGTVEGC